MCLYTMCMRGRGCVFMYVCIPEENIAHPAVNPTALSNQHRAVCVPEPNTVCICVCLCACIWIIIVLNNIAL